MSELRLSIRCDIKDGRLEEFKEVAAACLESVQTKDTGTLQYEWFLNEDGTKCVILERYDSSEALLEHIVNLGETFGALLDTCEMKVDMLGTPSAELLQATESIPRRIYSYYQGT